jgi:hypothetical protein
VSTATKTPNAIPATLDAEGNAHFYTADQIRVPSVTTVIGAVVRMPELERWREWVGTAQANQVRDEAAAHGQLLHAAAAVIADQTEDIPFDVEPRFAAGYSQFVSWFEASVDEVIAVEQPFVETLWRYGGRPDLVARVKGRKLPCLVDYKTSSGIYASHLLQTAAYRHAMAELLGMPIGDRLIVQIPRLRDSEQKPLQVHRFTRHTQDFAAWTNVLAVYRWMCAS